MESGYIISHEARQHRKEVARPVVLAKGRYCLLRLSGKMEANRVAGMTGKVRQHGGRDVARYGFISNEFCNKKTALGHAARCIGLCGTQRENGEMLKTLSRFAVDWLPTATSAKKAQTRSVATLSATR
jgi:hypothetical protein